MVVFSPLMLSTNFICRGHLFSMYLFTWQMCTYLLEASVWSMCAVFYCQRTMFLIDWIRLQNVDYVNNLILQDNEWKQKKLTTKTTTNVLFFKTYSILSNDFFIKCFKIDFDMPCNLSSNESFCSKQSISKGITETENQGIIFYKV